MSSLKATAERFLAAALGDGVCFHPGQWEAIEALVTRRRRVLVVQRTGWGKSWVYFLATKLLRDEGRGPTLIISPLLSLMRNQIGAIKKLGLNAETVNSTNTEDWDAVVAALRNDEVDILIVSPEQLGSEYFGRVVLPAARSLALLVIDEAHCISDWGHDFRPDYRRIVGIVDNLPGDVPVLATTATANDRVVEDIGSQLGDLEIQRGPLLRESLRLQVIRLNDQAERLAWLAENIPKLPGSGIIYCLTVRDCRRVADWLRQQGIDAQDYHSGLLTERKVELEDQLIRNEIKVLVATVALGMGFDKPDLGFVVHYQRPGSVVAYYQQMGRAGRALPDAIAVLMNGKEDDEIVEYFIDAAFPSAEDSQLVASLLASSDGLKLGELLSRANLAEGEARRILDLLQIEGAVTKEGPVYHRTPKAWAPNTMQHDQVTAKRRNELAKMQQLVEHTGCLMEFIGRELDDPRAEPCGRCANCVSPFLPADVQPAGLQAAIGYLKRACLPIEPRKQWPGDLGGSRRGRIPEELRLSPGLALSVYGDPGWGQLVKSGKYVDGRFPDELVDAMAELVLQKLLPQPFPTWLTAVPSLRHPQLVPEFAARLAARLGVPFKAMLVKTESTSMQKEMKNRYQQAVNAARSLGIGEHCPTGPVLLVDDIVDSGWTLTVCGELLLRAGAGPVYPVALASAGGGAID